jgi:hypothetical protein
MPQSRKPFFIPQSLSLSMKPIACRWPAVERPDLALLKVAKIDPEAIATIIRVIPSCFYHPLRQYNARIDL